MKTKQLYIIRHGETDHNLNNILQGSGTDLGLNETGIKQANAFFERYKNIPFRKIYTSCLKRSKQSVQQFTDLGIPVEAHCGLNEISYGEKDGTMRGENCDFYDRLVKDWESGNLNAKINGGESPLEVLERQIPFIDLIRSRETEDIILISMHGRAMRILLAYLLHKDLRYMHLYPHRNFCLYKLNFLKDKGIFFPEIKNDIAHLELVTTDIFNC